MPDWLKPTADKLTLTALLVVLHWFTVILSDWSADQLHTMTYPLLSQPLPYKVSFSQDWLAIFDNFWREVEQSKIPFIAIKFGISCVSSYLFVCLFFLIMAPGNIENNKE